MSTFLNHSNFIQQLVVDASKRQLVELRIVNAPEFCFVLFGSDDCVYCHDIFPIFKSLEQSISGCTFGLVNVTTDNHRIIEMSENTTTKLEYVPLLILYFQGRPLAQFNPSEKQPETNFESMKKFLIHYMTTMKSKNPNNNLVVAQNSIGIAGNLKRVCRYKKSELG